MKARRKVLVVGDQTYYARVVELKEGKHYRIEQGEQPDQSDESDESELGEEDDDELETAVAVPVPKATKAAPKAKAVAKAIDKAANKVGGPWPARRGRSAGPAEVNLHFFLYKLDGADPYPNNVGCH